MLVNGCDCSIIIKTTHLEKDIPYSDETIRDAVSLLEEEAAIEGDGTCRAIQKNNGATGCVVSPLTISTAPLLLSLAMGAVGKPVYVSSTRNMYKYELDLLPLEDTESFDLIQDRSKNNEQRTRTESPMNNEKRSTERKLYEGCRVNSFELRIMRDEAVKLKLDITSKLPPTTYPYIDTAQCQASKMNGTVLGSERFNGDSVTYKIDGQEYTNIYGITLVSKKNSGTITEIWIRRALEQGQDLPSIIEVFTITAQLLRDAYEYRHFGTFRITLKRLVLVSDETEIKCAGAVIGPLRYYVAGGVSMDFTPVGIHS